MPITPNTSSCIKKLDILVAYFVYPRIFSPVKNCKDPSSERIKKHNKRNKKLFLLMLDFDQLNKVNTPILQANNLCKVQIWIRNKANIHWMLKKK